MGTSVSSIFMCLLSADSHKDVNGGGTENIFQTSSQTLKLVLGSLSEEQSIEDSGVKLAMGHCD